MAVSDASLGISRGPIRMRVQGLSKVVRAAEKAGADAQDMRDLMHEIGMIVVKAAQPLTPHGQTGRLARSLRAGRGKTKAVVRAGGAKVPYAGVIHWGTPGGAIIGDYRPTIFLSRALQATQREAISKLSDGLADILKENNFDIKKSAGL